MNCPICKQPNAEQRNYCGGCGAALARYCSHCGFRNQRGDRFCGGCGASLDAGSEASATSPGAASPVPASLPPADGDLAELLAAAREGAAPAPEDLSAKVSQDDIDALFGE
jgi:hypothetical protein